MLTAAATGSRAFSLEIISTRRFCFEANAPPEGPTGSVCTGRGARKQLKGSAVLAGPRRSASDGEIMMHCQNAASTKTRTRQLSKMSCGEC